jgi:hypothetical protein
MFLAGNATQRGAGRDWAGQVRLGSDRLGSAGEVCRRVATRGESRKGWRDPVLPGAPRRGPAGNGKAGSVRLVVGSRGGAGVARSARAWSGMEWLATRVVARRGVFRLARLGQVLLVQSRRGVAGKAGPGSQCMSLLGMAGKVRMGQAVRGPARHGKAGLARLGGPGFGIAARGTAWPVRHDRERPATATHGAAGKVGTAWCGPAGDRSSIVEVAVG